MADIRTTPMLDDFQRPAENPLSGGGNWAGVNGSGLYISSPGHVHDPGASGGPGLLSVRLSYWTPQSFSVDGTNEVEVWCNCGGFADFQNGWSIGLASSISPFSGYLARWSEEIGNNAVQIRKWNAGVNTVLKDDRSFANAVPNSGTDILLFKTSGSLIQLWWSQDNGSNWVKRAEATDGTYRSGLRLVLGLDHAPEWLGFGGGIPRTFIPQIILRPRAWRP